jgi:hypothetical protein
VSTITCRFVYGERLFGDVYAVDIKVIAGKFPHSIGTIKQIKSQNCDLHVPIHYAEICKDKGEYRLFFNTSTAKEINGLQLVDDLQNRLIELEALDYSFFELQSNTRKVLFLMDELAIFEGLAIIHFLLFKKIEISLYVKIEQKQEKMMGYVQNLLPNCIKFISTYSYQEMLPILDEQLIGTRLFISGTWPMISEIKKVAYTAGFTDEEIQCKGIGRKHENVFCVKCYRLNGKKNEYEMVCEHCNTTLDVSTHFSRRLDAYLGYIKLI